MVAKNPRIPSQLWLLGPGCNPPARVVLVALSEDPAAPGKLVGDVLTVPPGRVACIAFVLEEEALQLLGRTT